MSQKKFLKLLEEKLQILSEEERKDILNEYKDTIAEKVRHGKSVEEAVADFGSIEELSREILKAYKINPDYMNSKDKVKDMVDEGENLIKKGAEKLSEWTQDVVEDFKNSDNNWTLETVFEVVIKAIILLIGLSFLRLPFYLIEGLGMNILEMSFLPFDSIFRIMFKCMISMIYFVICIIIGIIVFRPYFVTNQNRTKKNEIRKVQKKEDVNQKQGTGAGGVVIEILKAFVFLVTVFPLYFIDFGCYIGLAVLIFLWVEGVPILGVILILLGLSIFFTFLTRLFYNLLYGKKHLYCYSLIISAIVFASGFFVTLSTLSNFEVYNGLPNNLFSKKEVIYHETISEDYFKIPYWNVEKSIDSSLEDNQIEITVIYYSDFVKEIKRVETVSDDTAILNLKVSYQSLSKKTRKNLYDMVKNELKQLRWYHYSDVKNIEVLIRANEKTMEKVK